MRHSVYVVQDHETGHFLAPVNGSVGFVLLIRDAGKFENYESAAMTALDWCEQGFSVVWLLSKTD